MIKAAQRQWVMRSRAASLPSLPLWQPSAMTPALWIDASATGTYTQSNGVLSAFGDRTGKTAFNDAGYNLPFIGPALNGLPTFRQDGTCDAKFNVFGSNTNAPTGWCAAVFKADTTDADAPRLWQLRNTSTTSPTLMDCNSSWGYGLRIKNTSGSIYSAPTAPATTDWRIGFWKFQNSGTSFLRIDGITVSTRSYSGQTVSVRRMGFMCNGVTPDGTITPGGCAELSYGNNTQYTTANIEKMEGNLAYKWGLQANLADNHPYRYSPPYA